MSVMNKLLIGIYDNISKLEDAYLRVIKNEDHEYEFYLNNTNTKLTIAEFDRNSCICYSKSGGADENLDLI